MQRLELDLRFCDRKLDCFFCWSASPYLPLDPFLRRVRPRSSKKGATATSAQTLTFFQALDPFLSRLRPRSSNKGATFTSAPIFQFSRRWTPFWAVRGRDPPQRGASTWRLTRWLQLCFFFCAGKVHCFSARGSRCRQFMLGLLLLRYYNAKAWTWPPLLWSETGLLLLLIGFSLSTAGPLFAPCAAEILQKGGYRHISSDLDLFPGAGPLFAPWAAEILQKGGHHHISSDLYLFPGAGPLFWAVSGRDPPKRGPPPHQLRSLPFSRRWTPFWAVRGRDPPQRGASTWRQTRWLQLCFFFCAGKVHCFSARGSRCR